MQELILTEKTKTKRKPTHPGEILREEVLPAMNETVESFAKKIKVSKQALQSVLDCKQPISGETARQIGKVVGNGAQIWIDMQVGFDQWQNRKPILYPLTLTQDQTDGGFIVTFPDFPEAITQGDTEEQCLQNAADCLEEAIAARIDDGEAIPQPSKAPDSNSLTQTA